MDPPAAYVPFLHVWHSCWPVWLVKVPIWQSWHELAPPCEIVPGPHGMQPSLLFSAVNEPGGHAVQDDAFGEENWPTGQGWHIELPSNEKVPAWQMLQFVLASLEANDPCGQARHTLAESCEKVPVGQWRQAVAWKSENVPAAQDVQFRSSSYVPGRHG